MKGRFSLIFAVLTAIGIIFISGCTQLEDQPVPENLTYGHTNYTNCQANSDYPFQTDKDLTTIRGEVEIERGSKMYPWKAAVVNGSYLFNPETSDLISNFDKMEEKTVEIKGYSGTGYITMQEPFEENKTKEIRFGDAFFVSEISGWRNVCCNVVNWQGNISSQESCIWFESSQLN